MAWFMLAMVLFPDTQRKAQEELDVVVGRGRLPTFDDLESLVYIQAIVKEILRWHPVGPLGKYLTPKPYHHVHIIMFLVPMFSLGMQHRSTEVGDQVLVDSMSSLNVERIPQDDMYDGYFIPKGTICIPNIWLVFVVTVQRHSLLLRTQGDQPRSGSVGSGCRRIQA